MNCEGCTEGRCTITDDTDLMEFLTQSRSEFLTPERTAQLRAWLDGND